MTREEILEILKILEEVHKRRGRKILTAVLDDKDGQEILIDNRDENDNN